mmetsp:Transcript_40997/g.68645  ORF Transcript_40997/g.68645 Transcript_40997/m.68645 type:complete len:236 (-) Transcript_40997:641-1348(-)|eukprot:CAMPEP_0198211322 /NCGR_PEP_ID=MMETSP1445-20131203/23156_1 /TAXON_ID=36898 /ORGANISM="Pyramimonas sp., Strain CCMP2087" /LENGTH=235 /DNA_ID=CAMNT_0043885549 /DNA_START=102 /DNA_END=809 /DNA_ORIENTATION=+
MRARLFFLTLFAVSALSYTITVKEKESECLYEEFSRDSLLPGENQETVSTEVSIAFTVKNLMYMRATFNSVISVNVTDPHGNLLFEKSPVTEEEILFTAHGTGYYTMCFFNKGDKSHGIIPYDKRQVKINVAYFMPLHKINDPAVILTPRGNEDNRGSQLLDKESISVTHKIILDLKAQIRLVASEQRRFKAREQRHRETVESTNRRTLHWALFETMAFAGANCLQVFVLRRFFR